MIKKPISIQREPSNEEIKRYQQWCHKQDELSKEERSMPLVFGGDPYSLDNKDIRFLKRLNEHLILVETTHFGANRLFQEVRNNDNVFVGTLSDELTKYILNKNINPEPIDRQNICSIGFCAEDNKWYGWSHRAIYGFTIGSEVKEDSINYNKKYDSLEDKCNVLNKNKGKYYKFLIVNDHIEYDFLYTETVGLTSDNVFITKTGWIRSVDKVTNKPYMIYNGKGAWKANTIEDAKQMAIDFARAVC